MYVSGVRLGWSLDKYDFQIKILDSTVDKGYDIPAVIGVNAIAEITYPFGNMSSPFSFYIENAVGYSIKTGLFKYKVYIIK